MDEWLSISEQPWTLTERAMQGSVRVGKAWPLGRIETPSAAITPAEKGEEAMKLPTLPPSNIGTAGEYKE